MAVNFWNRKLMKVCLYSWLKYTRHKMEKKMLKLEHEQKAKKMERFINSAANMLQQNQQVGQGIDEQVGTFPKFGFCHCCSFIFRSQYGLRGMERQTQNLEL